MKKRASTTIKGLSAFLSVILLITAVFPNYALAAEQTGTDPNISLYSALDDEDLSINAEVATCIAELFVRDMIATGTTVWDESTEPVNTVTMYDETGEVPTAYSVELTDGYIVVSAFIDVPNIIFEWSDKRNPFYSSKNESDAISPMSIDGSNTKIIYMGPLNFFFDTGNEELALPDGNRINREQLSNHIEDVRDIHNVNERLLNDITAQKSYTCGDDSVSPLYNHRGEVITNAGKYAENVYGGKWKCLSYANNWENYRQDIVIQEDVPLFKEACGPIAIANTIKMIDYRRGSEQNKKQKGKDLVALAAYTTKPNGRRYYTNGEGVNGYELVDFADAALKRARSNLYCGTPLSKLTSTTVVNCLYNDNGLLLCLLYPNLDNLPFDNNHIVSGYAYCRLIPTNAPSPVRTFLKINDGLYESDDGIIKSRDGTYIDLGVIKHSECTVVKWTTISSGG